MQQCLYIKDIECVLHMLRSNQKEDSKAVMLNHPPIASPVKDLSIYLHPITAPYKNRQVDLLLITEIGCCAGTGTDSHTAKRLLLVSLGQSHQLPIHCHVTASAVVSSYRNQWSCNLKVAHLRMISKQTHLMVWDEMVEVTSQHSDTEWLSGCQGMRLKVQYHVWYRSDVCPVFV